VGERRRQRTSRLPLGIDVVLAPIHHPLQVAARMATLDILSRGRVEAGIGCTGYPRMPGSASPAACLQPAGRTARRPVASTTQRVPSRRDCGKRSSVAERYDSFTQAVSV